MLSPMPKPLPALAIPAGSEFVRIFHCKRAQSNKSHGNWGDWTISNLSFRLWCSMHTSLFYREQIPQCTNNLLIRHPHHHLLISVGGQIWIDFCLIWPSQALRRSLKICHIHIATTTHPVIVCHDLIVIQSIPDSLPHKWDRILRLGQ